MVDGIITRAQMDELFPPKSPVLSAPYLKSLWPTLRGGYSESFGRWLETRYGFSESQPH